MLSIEERRRLARQAGGLTRQGCHKQADEIRAELKLARAEEFARELVESWPPLTDEQRMRIAAVLLPVDRREAA